MKHPVRDSVVLLAVFALAQIACSVSGAPSVRPSATLPPAATLTAPASEAPTRTSPAPSATLAPPTPTRILPTRTPTATVFVPKSKFALLSPSELEDMHAAFVQTSHSLGSDATEGISDYSDKVEIKQVSDAIHGGAKGIAIQVFAPITTLGAALDQVAKDAGVPLLTLNIQIRDAKGKPLPFLHFDQSEAGKKAGETAMKYLNESGWLSDSNKKVGLISLEASIQPLCTTRTSAAKQAVSAAGFPGKRIFPVEYDWIMTDSQVTTGPLLKAHPEITNWMVLGCTGYAVDGGLKALAAAGVKPEDIIAVGIDASPANMACTYWAAGQPTGFKATVELSLWDLGSAAASLLNDAVLNGKPLPADTVVPAAIIDPENYKTALSPSQLANCAKK